MSSIPRKAWKRLKKLIRPTPEKIVEAVEEFGKAYPNACFVQIGANDGLVRDPLRIQVEKRQWHGVMVEPVPYVFAKLKGRYGEHPRVALENSAISETNGEMSFYHLRQAEPGEEVWQWYHALGSFRKDVVLSHKHLIPDIEERLIETIVPSLSFDTLCAKHSLSSIDLLQTDTEGYDYEIIKTIDFERWRPRMLIYEHFHLSDDDKAAAQSLLHSHGYELFEHGLDTACLHLPSVDANNKQLLRHFSS